MKTWGEVDNLIYYIALSYKRRFPHVEVDELVNEAYKHVCQDLDTPFLGRNAAYWMKEFIINDFPKHRSIEEEMESLDSSDAGSLVVEDVEREDIVECNVILSQDEKMILWLRFVLDLPIKKIASLYHVSRQYMYVYLKKILGQVKEGIKQCQQIQGMTGQL